MQIFTKNQQAIAHRIEETSDKTNWKDWRWQLKHAIKSIDKDQSVIKSIKLIHKNFSDIVDIIFAKGGDRTLNNIPEREICEKLNIEMQFGIGGKKIQSSSKLIKKCKEKK